MEEWLRLEKEIETCRRCELHRYRKKPVPGDGDKRSPVIFVGEAPGRDEDEMGKPFVGAAGKLLTQLIESMGYRREEFYITNVVKCRPPGNRDPLEEEIEACLPYLIEQIMLIRPKVIVTLGRHASRTLFNLTGLKWINMSTQHGKIYEAVIKDLRVKIIPTFHPASALYNPGLKKYLELDFRNVIKKAIEEVKGAQLTERRRSLLDFAKRHGYTS